MMSQSEVERYRNELLDVLRNIERQEVEVKSKLLALDIVLHGGK